METPNQLLMSVHDAVWAAAYAQSGLEVEPPSLRATLLADVKNGPPADEPASRPRQRTASELRAEVAARVRT